jgi:hypothetical protein
MAGGGAEKPPAVLSLAHDDFDGVVSCALAGCPHPRRTADYPDLPRLLEGYEGELYATEVNDLGLYERLPRVVLYDHHMSVHRVLGLEPGIPVKAVYERGRGWRAEAVGAEPAPSMVSGLRQLGVPVPGWLARIGDVLDNFALAETEEEWRIVAGYLASLRERWWREEILAAETPSEAAEKARSVVEEFRRRGDNLDWGRVRQLEEEAKHRALGTPRGPVPVIIVGEEEEGLGRLAMLRIEKRYPYVVLLRVRPDGLVKGTIVSLRHSDAPELARRLGGGGRPLWPTGSIAGFSLQEPPGRVLEELRKLLAETSTGPGGA